MNRIYFKVSCHFLMILFFIVSIALAGNDEKDLSEKDAYILIDNLLNISNPQTVREQFIEYEKWSNIYIKYREKSHLNKNEMKIYLFIVFIADKSVRVHTLEEISEEIMSKFEAQTKIFLEVIRDSPFLAETTFSSLSSHFPIHVSKEVKNNQINNFIQKYEKIIIEYLGNKLGNKCLLLIKET